MQKTISDWLNPVPLLAILRGITPHEVDEVGDVLIELGYRILEVPLNSPDPYQSIQKLAKRYSGSALIGAGTVLKPEQVPQVADAGPVESWSDWCFLGVGRYRHKCCEHSDLHWYNRRYFLHRSRRRKI